MRSDKYAKKAQKVTPKVEKKPKKKRRLKIKNVLFLMFIIVLAFFVALEFNNIKITNVYISGNNIVSDQEIMDESGLINYPSIFTPSSNFKSKLLQNELIKDVKIRKELLSVYVEITENYPLYYYESDKTTMLLNGKTTTNKYQEPVLINYVPDTIYSNFIKAMQGVKYEIVLRISEIKYDPDTVDDSRFLLTMCDGNYVYLTITKWNNINEYTNIIKEFPGKKGILYLNAGNSFEVKETIN